MPVVRIDLRQPAVRSRLRELRAPASTDPFPFSDGSVTELPIRLLLVVPLDDTAATDYEELSLKLLGSDPSPRALVALVSGGEVKPRRKTSGSSLSRTLPAALGIHPDVRFLDLRSRTLSIGHPQTGLSQLAGEEDGRWPDAFAHDMLSQLAQVEVFDAVWEAIPADRPATAGMRVAALGAGRERAVADLALRLSEVLLPDREPSMGTRLPQRWEIDPRLLPAAPPYPALPARDDLPSAVRGLAAVADAGTFRLLGRRRDTYNEGVASVIAELDGHPARLAELLRQAERTSPESGPRIDPIGAANLDAAMGGTLFGDELARAVDEGDDSAARVGEQLEVAAQRQADGLSAALLAHWLRTDADRVEPMGPRAAADRLTVAERPWSKLAAELRREAPARGTADWIRDANAGDPGGQMPKPKPASGAPATDADAGTDDGAERVAGVPVAPAWELPARLRWIVGAPLWRPPLRWLTMALTVLLVALVIAQLYADLTQTYLLADDRFLLGIPIPVYRTAVTVAAWALVVYLILGLIVARGLRRWGRRFRFEEVPGFLADMDREAHALAVAEVARFAVRRDYARVARAAADTLEHGSRRASEVAGQFGAALRDRFPPETIEPVASVPPHRELLPAEGSLSGTDAGGIYRVYPLYLDALLSLFAASMVRAIRERWPRIRGVFWEETETSIVAATAAILEHRLGEILEFGLRRGDLVQDGSDPADDLAERLWANPAIRDRALRALHLDPADPIPLLATPADARLLDQGELSDLIIAIPPTLEPLVSAATASEGVHVITSAVLETAAAIRIFPFQPGIYDFAGAPDTQASDVAS